MHIWNVIILILVFVNYCELAPFFIHISYDDPVFKGWKGSAVEEIFKSYHLKPSTVAFNTENFLK